MKVFFKIKEMEVRLELLEAVQLQDKSWNVAFHLNSLLAGKFEYVNV